MKNRKINILKILFKVRKNRKSKNKVFSKHSGIIFPSFKFFGHNNKVIVDDSILYKCKFHIFGSNNTIIINKNCMIQETVFWIEEDNNKIEIGSNSHICGHTQLACLEGKEIIIGQDALFSKNIQVRTSDSHSLINFNGNRINNAENVSLGNHVWVCENVTILKGTQIKDNSVIACNSLINSKFDSGHIVVGGTPAKILKENIDWKADRI